MHSNPGRVQRFSRLTATVNSFTSSQLFTSASPDFRIGAMRAMSSSSAGSPLALTASYCPLGITKAHCQ
jgi:hypothetical protein